MQLTLIESPGDVTLGGTFQSNAVDPLSEQPEEQVLSHQNLAIRLERIASISHVPAFVFRLSVSAL